MAPKESGSIALEALTIANCRSISESNADFVIVTPSEPLVGFKAIVLRTLDGTRDLFLSATGRTVTEALWELHLKSADAARHYFSINGYGFPPVLKKRDSKRENDRGSDLSDVGSSPVDLFGSEESSSSSCDSLSDDEIVSVASGVGGKREKHKSRKFPRDIKASRATQSRSRSGSRSSSRSPSRSPRRSCSIDSKPQNRRERQPEPTDLSARPGQLVKAATHPTQGGNYPSPLLSARAVGAASPPNQAVTTISPSPRNGAPLSAPRWHDVLLRIHWIGRGQAQVMETMIVTLHNLRARALNYVRRNPDAFPDASPADAAAMKLPLGSPGSLGLVAFARKAVIGVETVDLRTYTGNDLGRLLPEPMMGSSLALPKFEIMVQSAPCPPTVKGVVKNGSNGVKSITVETTTTRE